jgi:hypothetical protein
MEYPVLGTLKDINKDEVAHIYRWRYMRTPARLVMEAFLSTYTCDSYVQNTAISRTDRRSHGSLLSTYTGDSSVFKTLQSQQQTFVVMEVFYLFI